MAEETEVISSQKSDSFWDTYQEFFLSDDAVEVSDAEVNLVADGMNARHELTSDQAHLELGLSVDDTSHTVYSEDPWNHSLWAQGPLAQANSSHSLTSDEPWVEVPLTVNDSEHELTSDQSGVSTSSKLFPYETEHLHEVDGTFSVLAVCPDVDVDEPAHLLFDGGGGITLVSNFELEVDDAYHRNMPDDNMWIGEDGDAVFPRDGSCAHSADGVGSLTLEERLPYVGTARHRHEAEDSLALSVNYILPDISDTGHKVQSGMVVFPTVRADSATHRQTASRVWSWMNGSVHEVDSGEARIEVHLDVTDCEHQLHSTGNLEVTPHLTPADCQHFIFTPDTLAPDNCSHALTSDELQANTKYRRIYV